MLHSDIDINKLIADKVKAFDPDAQAILFGSRARGTSRADSDWDVLILVNSPRVTNKQFEALNYDIWAMGLEYGQTINPIVMTRHQWENARPSLFKHNIIKEGIIL